MSLSFEWDEEKAKLNEMKHRVSFEEAKTVMNDPLSLTIFDAEHSELEDRWLDLGVSNLGRVLVVWYTESGGMIRLIGARKATQTEIGNYFDGRSK